MRRYRVDFGTLGDAEVTQSGGLRVPADLTRTGVFTYHLDTGETIREYRPPEEVFRAETLATLKGATLTVDHPPEQIGPSTFRQYTTGHVGDDVRRDGEKVAATCYIQDQSALAAIKAGRREISCGYHCDVDETPGVTPDGEPYDRVQKSIFYNHVALVDNGRAGPDVRLRLDSAGNQIHREDPSMPDKIELVDGIEYTVGTDAHRAARERFDSAQAKLKSNVQKLQQERDEARGRADAADAQLAKVVAGAKKLLSPERLDALVRTRSAVVRRAKKELGANFKTDGLSNREIRIAVLKKAYPQLRLDSADSAYLKGLWAGLVNAPKAARMDSLDRLRVGATPIPSHLLEPPRSGARSLDDVRRDAAGESESRSGRPLALSRRDRFKQLSSHPMLQGAQLEVMK